MSNRRPLSRKLLILCVLVASVALVAHYSSESRRHLPYQHLGSLQILRGADTIWILCDIERSEWLGYTASPNWLDTTVGRTILVIDKDGVVREVHTNAAPLNSVNPNSTYLFHWRDTLYADQDKALGVVPRLFKWQHGAFLKAPPEELANLNEEANLSTVAPVELEEVFDSLSSADGWTIVYRGKAAMASSNTSLSSSNVSIRSKTIESISNSTFGVSNLTIEGDDGQRQWRLIISPDDEKVSVPRTAGG